MKLQWKIRKDEKKATSNTPYASLFAREADDGVFVAFVSSHRYNATLRYTDNLPTLEAAQAWCEDAYADLLRAELAALTLHACACGAQPVAVTEGEPGHEGYFVVCQSCYASAPSCADYNAACEGWNRGEREKAK